MLDNLSEKLQNIYGVDLSFDSTIGIQEVEVDEEIGDFRYVSGPAALVQEIERLFALTDEGSFVEDPSYGLNLRQLIGTAMDPRILVNLVRLRVIRALEHPSFRSRFEVGNVEAVWSSAEPGTIRVTGVIRCFGFEDLDWVSFGPFSLAYWRPNV